MSKRVDFPDKLFFKIGEVAKLTGIKQHVLRYWESEFTFIRPQKNKSNQRLYRRRDVEAVLAIKHLLYDKKFTIEGAKKPLRAEGIDAALPPPDPKKVAEQARKKALDEMGDAIEKERAKMIKGYSKNLVDLRQEVLKFLKELELEE